MGRYEFCDGHVKVRYTNDTGLCEIALKLGHAAQGYFSEQLLDKDLGWTTKWVWCVFHCALFRLEEKGKPTFGKPEDPS